MKSRPLFLMPILAAVTVGAAALDATTTAQAVRRGESTELVLAEFFQTNIIHRYDAETGDYLGVFSSSDLIRGTIGMELGPDEYVYIANATSSNIVRLDSRTGRGEVFASDSLTNPYDVIFAPNGDLYVSSLGSNKIVRFDGTSGTVLGVITPGEEIVWPEGMAFGPQGNLYVSGGRSHTVAVYSVPDGELMRVIGDDVLRGPSGLLFTPRGDLIIANTNAHSVLRMRDGVLLELIPPEAFEGESPRYPEIGPDGNLYVSSGRNVRRFDLETGRFIDVFATTPAAPAMGFVFVEPMD